MDRNAARRAEAASNAWRRAREHMIASGRSRVTQLVGTLSGRCDVGLACDRGFRRAPVALLWLEYRYTIRQAATREHRKTDYDRAGRCVHV